MKKLDELTIVEILKKIDFSEEFINKFKYWCKHTDRYDNSAMDTIRYSTAIKEPIK